MIRDILCLILYQPAEIKTKFLISISYYLQE